MTVSVGALAILCSLLIALVIGLVALSVLLSFSIAWVDRANHRPELAAQRHYLLAVQLLAAEFFCLLLTLVLRPLGWLPTRIPAGPTRQTPVILLHGLFQNRSCLLPLTWRLRAAGFDRVISINTPPWHDLEVLTERLRRTVAEVRKATGAQRVHLVGHSMGGIIARNFLQLHGGAPDVARCVTLGSPHRGSKLAVFAVSRLGRGLLPGSALLTRLNAAPLPDQVAFTAIHSRHDNIIIPLENARLEGADNIELAGIGHTALLFSSRTADAVIAALTEDNL